MKLKECYQSKKSHNKRVNYKSLSITTAIVASVVVLFSSCATICGGSNYYAHINVSGHPKAHITYNGLERGMGQAMFKVKRKDADKLSIIVKEDNCQEQTFNYVGRTFRGWALAGTIVTFTGSAGGVPLPWGVGLDLITGALWKPNVMEKGVTKDDYKNFNYLVNYTGCAK